MSTTTNTTDLAHVRDGVTLPSVRGLRHAALLAHQFPAVLTVGPHHTDVDWGHPNHHVEVFGDVSDPNHQWAPRMAQVKRALEFGMASNDPILIHCHAGISRSSATAIGVTIGRGLAPSEAVAALAEIHPAAQAFAPNEVIIGLIEDYFDLEAGSLFDEVVKYDRLAYTPRGWK